MQRGGESPSHGRPGSFAVSRSSRLEAPGPQTNPHEMVGTPSAAPALEGVRGVDTASRSCIIVLADGDHGIAISGVPPLPPLPREVTHGALDN